MSNESATPELPALTDCLLRDRHRFRRRLNRLRNGDSKARDQLQRAMAASAQQRASRAALTPRLEWPALPVCERLEDLAAAINQHQVVVVAGETGSGKTTQLPKICLSLGRGVDGMIGHTQPRRLAARAVASRLAEELAGEVGREVGLQVRFQDQSSDLSLVKVMTDGILLAEIQRDPFLNQYDTLIIDEAHERSLNIDFLLGYLKTLLPRRPELKLIITSATIDHQRFAAHFNEAPVLEVSGRTWPVTVHYRPPASEQDMASQIEQVLHEIESRERESGRGSACDVLVFLSGEREIREAHHHLRRCQFRDTEFLPLYARLSRQEQQRVFAPHRGRRVVLATNVAETSLTVPGIRYVIDGGSARISRYSVQSKVQRLPVEAISRASADQRAGRCGRVMPGDCFRLYAEDDYLQRPAFTEPEIQRTNLASVILRMADLRLGEVADFPFIDPPEGKLVRDGYRLLEELGALAQKGLSATGQQLARLPVDPRLGRMLLEAGQRAALREVLVIVSALAVQDPRERPQEARQAADQAHQAFADEKSDFLLFLNLWHWAEQQRDELSRNQFEKQLRKHFLSPVRMREWRETHRQLLLLCRELNLPINREAADYELIHRSLLPGLLSLVMQRTDEGEWLSTRNRKPLIWPGSAVRKPGGKWLACAELVETSKLFARTVAVVAPEWIEDAASHLIKRSWHEPHWSKRRGCVMAKEQAHLFGLLLRSGKRVNYGPIDPVLSREIMVREGLVAGQLSREPGFVTRNREKIAELEEMEARLRRRDLVADEERLVAFYLARLPDKLVNLADLEHWYSKRASPAERDALLMSEDFLLADRAPDLAGFPDQMDCDGTLFPLRYQFTPDGDADGVTVVTPVEALANLSEARLAWLVPGLLDDKLEALIRGLPKALRRNFVPVPEFVRALRGTLAFADGDLFDRMTRELQRITGVRVEREQWLAVSLPAHLHAHVEVVSGQQVLARDDDLGRLRERFSGQAQTLAPEPAPAQWHAGWPPEPLPATRQADRGGVQVTLYPALEAGDAGVRVRDCEDARQAAQIHRFGLARLVLLQQAAQTRELRQHWRRQPGWKQALQDKGLGGQALLEQALLRHAVEHFGLDQELRSPQVLAARVRERAGDWLGAATDWLGRWEQWWGLRQTLQRRLGKDFPLAWAHAHGDISAQLEALFFADFLLQVPTPWLAEYGRYLEAIQWRIDKLGGRINQDRAWSAELAEWWQRYTERTAGRPLWQQPEPLVTLRFMLEEFRVSLFAQPLGTRVSVSAKKLRQQWESC